MNNKYKFEGGQIINLATNKPIPAEEPVFILRAQDATALPTMLQYIAQQQDGDHRHVVEALFLDFEQWQIDHPQAVKRADTHLPGSCITSWEFKGTQNQATLVANVTPTTGLMAYQLAQDGWKFIVRPHETESSYGLVVRLEIGDWPTFFQPTRDDPAAITAAADRVIREAFGQMQARGAYVRG
jgi:hypothetical protein